MRKYTMTIVLVSVALLSMAGAAMIYITATDSHQIYAVRSPVVKGTPIDPQNLRTVEVSTVELVNLVDRDLVNLWIQDGYVASRSLPESTWLNPADYVAYDPKPEGYVYYNLEMRARDAEVGERIRLYADNDLLGVHPFPCKPDVDMMVSAAQRTGVSTLGWTQAHARGLNIPQSVIDATDPSEGGWRWYRLMASVGRAGISPSKPTEGAYLEPAALLSYKPRIHLAPYYNILCGMALFEIIAVGETNSILEIPAWMVPDFQMADFKLAVLPPDGSEPDARYLSASPPVEQAVLHAPLIASNLNV